MHIIYTWNVYMSSINIIYITKVYYLYVHIYTCIHTNTMHVLPLYSYYRYIHNICKTHVLYIYVM